ncbi:MAG: PatB family C-S lyase [Rhodocyclaceae bacterium]|nr:PatB family C-S lyase [Rhodocyclaceae bacterium]
MAERDFDFATPVHAADSVRWSRFAGRDVIPLTLADMDFAAPPAVIDALRRRAESGAFGYGQPTASLVEAVLEHCRRAYGWAIDPHWLVWLPGLVPALHVACRAVGAAGDGVLTATPVYPPFLSAPIAAGRKLITLPLVRDEYGQSWTWDFCALTALAKSARLLLLCHPHNPVGRVWNEAELWQIAHLAEKYDWVVVSDEIHGDLTHLGRHKPFATLAPELAQRTITLMAPSKTYNIAGLACAYAIIPHEGLRNAFRAVAKGIVPDVNVMGLTACEAALREGEPWRCALIEVLRAQAAQVEQAIAAMPGLSVSRVEAGFLAWIDCRDLPVPDPAAFFEAAGVGLSAGAAFGPADAYRRFVRLNFGTPRGLLAEALARMEKACRQLFAASVSNE